MSDEKLIQLRGGMSVTWTAANPVLALREVGLETDTRKQKVGDGITPWNSLPYFGVSDAAFDSALADIATKIDNAALQSALADYYTAAATDTLLSGKAASSHTHTLSNLTQSGATTNQVAQWNGTAWVPATVSGGSSLTVAEVDGTPSMTATTIRVPNGSLTDAGGGVASLSFLQSGGALGTPSSGNLANCTFPTLNQNTTGSAATLTTARNINGVAFDGSEDITIADSTKLALSGGTLTGLLNITQATANTSYLNLTGYSVTGTSSVDGIDIAGTWNTTGTPTAFDLNITDTASNTNSLLMNLRRGGVSQFCVFKSGIVAITGDLRLGNNGKITTVGATGALRFFSGLAAILDGAGGQTILDVDSNYTLALKYSTNANRLNIYGTHTDASNYRRLYLSSTTAGAFTLGVEGLGTGASGNTLTVNGSLYAVPLTSDSFGEAFVARQNATTLAAAFYIKNAANSAYLCGFSQATNDTRFANYVSSGSLLFYANGADRLSILSTGAAVFSSTITHVPSASVTLGTNGQMAIEMTSNTNGNIVYRGSDGTTRRFNFTVS